RCEACERCCSSARASARQATTEPTMKANHIKDWFFDLGPFRRRSSIDWLLPAGIGLGLGVAAGVGVGLLYAPESGVETRRKLRSRANEAKERARTFADRARERIAARTDLATERLEQYS